MLTANRIESLVRLLADGEDKVDQMLDRERDDVKQVLAYVRHSLKMARNYLLSAKGLKAYEVVLDARAERKCVTCGGKLK